MKLAAGILVGLVLGFAVSALAAGQWRSGADLMLEGRSFRMGYAAGAGDMLLTVVELNQQRGPQPASVWLVRQAQCLEKKAAEGKLGWFTVWLEHLWYGSSSLAAGVMLDRACGS